MAPAGSEKSTANKILLGGNMMMDLFLTRHLQSFGRYRSPSLT
jgi:hypothetical protein